MNKIFLCALFIIAFILRFYLLPENLFFGPEQGIDFNVIKNIVVSHDLTLIGAKTDVSGIFHGPIYYYLATAPFFISKGDPLVILAFFIVLNSLTVFFIFLLGKELFNKQVGMFSAILFTVSYGSIVYARWLSSHPLTIPLSCLFFISIYKFLQGKKIFLLFASLFFALIGQAEFLNFLFFGMILVFLMITFKDVFLKQNKLFLLLYFSCLVIFSGSNYFIFDLRHNYIISKSFMELIGRNSGYYVTWERSILENTAALIRVFTSSVAPFNAALSLIILFTGTYFFIKLIRLGNKYALSVLIWLFLPFVLLIFLRHDFLEQFFVGIVPASIVFTSVTIEKIRQKNKYIGITLLLLIVIMNISGWISNIPENRNIFFQSTQLRLKFSDQKKVLDTIYKEANGKPFSFQSYTIPYWSQQGWEYLFWYYGKQKYGYLPIEEKAKTLFVIIQIDRNNRVFQENWLNNTVNKWGNKKKSFVYGDLEIQELKVERN